jgi:hypothetical protein
MAGSEIWDQFISHCGSFQESHGSKEQIPLFVPVTRRYRLQRGYKRRAKDEAFGDPEITVVFHDADTGI